MPDYDEMTKQWRQSLIERIIKARTDQRLTQEQLAKMVGTQRSSISRLESGSHNPSLDFLLNVAAALHMELDLVPRKRRTRLPWKISMSFAI